MEELEKKEKRAVAGNRSSIYGFLATVYRQEVTPYLLQQIKDPQFLGVLSDLGIQWAGDLFNKPDRELLDELAVEYVRLFLGPGRHISPHESVHHENEKGPWGQLWGEATVEVKKLIESSSLQYKPEFSGLPDHISVELEFMQKVTRREEHAWEEGDKETALHCIHIEKTFVEDHLIHWIPAFCDKVISAAESPFYRDMALLTKNFIEFEKQEINKYGDGGS